jgi:hypothetical protein
MKSDIGGVSQCVKGEERYETFRRRGKRFFQYEYRTMEGELISCIKPTLTECRDYRDRIIYDRDYCEPLLVGGVYFRAKK